MPNLLRLEEIATTVEKSLRNKNNLQKSIFKVVFKRIFEDCFKLRCPNSNRNRSSNCQFEIAEQQRIATNIASKSVKKRVDIATEITMLRTNRSWVGFGIARVRCTPRGSCNRTLLRRVLRRFSNSKCFLEGFLEGACKGFQ